MTHDPLDQLRAELAAIDPSPAFAAGVRARIGAQSWHMFRLQPMLAFAAVAVVAVAGGTYLLQRNPAVAPIAQTPVAQVATVPVPIETSAVPAPNVAAPRRLPAPTRPVAPPVIAEAAPGPFLEVITNQPQIIGRIWAGIDGGVARVGLPANEFAQITVAPVHVDAIVVPKIGPPGGGGGIVPGARRVMADDSMRGDQR
jgi:hypothetical protein